MANAKKSIAPDNVDVKPKNRKSAMPAAQLRGIAERCVADIKYIEQEMKSLYKCKNTMPGAHLSVPCHATSKKLQSIQVGRRGPISVRVVDFLLAYRAWLHAEWIIMRGEQLFPESLSPLEKADVIAAPSQPVPRLGAKKRGRPADVMLVLAVRSIVGEALHAHSIGLVEALKNELTPDADTLRQASARYLQWTGRRINPTIGSYRTARRRIGFAGSG